jgi:hypothetical protein
MLQSDGEPAWQVKTYNALRDKKHLTGINKEGILNLLEKFLPDSKFNAFPTKCFSMCDP